MTLPDGVIPLWELSASKKTTQALDDATERKLQAVVDVDFQKTTIRDALTFLSQDGKRFRVIVDEPTLKDAQITLNERVTLRLKGFSIEHVLRRVLEQQTLAWFIRNGNVFVTTQEAETEPEHYFVRTYSLQGLESPEASRLLRNRQARSPSIDSSMSSPSGTEYEWILDAIKSETGGIWASDGTGGALTVHNKMLVASQTFRIHREIFELLRALRLASQGKLHSDAFNLRFRNYPYAKDREIYRKLAGRATLRLTNLPLNKALAQIAQTLGVSFWEDRRSLGDAQIELDGMVSFEAKGESWSGALKTILSPTGVGYQVEDGTIRIMTEPAVSEQRWSYLFDVRDLTKAGIPARRVGEMIRSQTAAIWGDGDPSLGKLTVNPDLGVIIVRHGTRGIHSTARLLQSLRAHLEKTRKSAGTPPPSKYLSRVEIRYYPVSDGDKAKELARAIPLFVEPTSWKPDRFTAAIKVVDGTLIIRQTVKVHQAIREFIRDLEPPAPPNGGLGGLGGGFF